jgi:beta-phosphoglucomutase-like phosphatase (HAD superfamily)
VAQPAVTGIHREQIMPPTTTLPRKAAAVILDMDGLMFDTEALYRDAVIAAAADGGHDISTAFYLSTIGMSLEATRSGIQGALRERLRFRPVLDHSGAISRDHQIAAVHEARAG